MKWFPFVASALLCATTGLALGQGKNIVPNAGFESSKAGESLWDGTTKDGSLAGFRFSVPILDEKGGVRDNAMPLSIDIADMNGDGLQDIITSDPVGYIRVYLNSGTPQEPKFTFGELTFPFVSNALTYVNFRKPDVQRRVPKIDVTEIGGGVNNLLVGLYGGELLAFRNSAGTTGISYDQPTDISRQLLATTEKPGEIWANLLAPQSVDWNQDGRMDLLLGEGSYSANNVHLLLNQAGTGGPRFTEGNRYVVAFGDGKEQLTPAVADLDADGQFDLVVGDRLGRLSLYMSKGNAWEPGSELEFASFLAEKGGKEIKYTGIVSVAAGDLTGDGLTDLVVGQTNGRLDFYKNVGSATEPAFTKAALKGTNSPNQVATPSDWESDFGELRGNFYGTVSVVTAKEFPELAPPEGKAALWVGYEKSPNTFIRAPQGVIPGWPEKPRDHEGDEKYADGWHQSNLQGFMAPAPSNIFNVRAKINGKLDVGARYKLTFKAKGSGATNVYGRVNWGHDEEIAQARLQQGARAGAVKRVGRQRVTESGTAETPVSLGNDWREYSISFTPALEKEGLEEIKQPERAAVQFIGELRPGEGEIFIDDVVLVKEG